MGPGDSRLDINCTGNSVFASLTQNGIERFQKVSSREAVTMHIAMVRLLPEAETFRNAVDVETRAPKATDGLPIVSKARHLRIHHNT